MPGLERVAVFCGSSMGVDPAFAEAAHELGSELARRDLGLVFGGSNVGLMGVVAESALAGGARVVGVYPDVFSRDIAHLDLDELHVVPTMHERKALMYELADAVIALPGGLGTLEEVFECATWNQIGLHETPIPVALVDVNGYYEALHAFLDNAVAAGLLKQKYRATVRTEPTPAAALDHVTTFDFAASEPGDKWDLAP